MTHTICSPNAKIHRRKKLVTSTYVYKRSFRGEGQISGIISVDAQPVVGYRVQLFHSATGYFIAETLSNIDGTYAFTNLDRTQLYDVIAFDTEGVWEKRISSRRRPKMMDIQLNVALESGESARASVTGESSMGAFWRVYVTSSSHVSVAVSELEMMSEKDGPNLCTGGIAIASSEYDTTWIAERAFDTIRYGTIGWTSTGTGMPQWIGYQFPESVKVSAVRITTRSDFNSSPIDFHIQNSDDGVTWTTKWSIINSNNWGLNETRVFHAEESEILPDAFTQSGTWGPAFVATPENMRDGDFTTGAATATATSNEWIMADLGAIKAINKITVAGGSMSEGWSPVSNWLNGSALQWSYDGVSWNNIRAISGVVDDNYTNIYFPIVMARYWRLLRSGYLATTEFRFFGFEPDLRLWRVFITANNGSTVHSSLSELEMAEEPAGPNLCHSGNFGFGPYYSSDGMWNVRNLFDGIKNRDDGWASPAWDPVDKGIGYGLPADVVVNEVRLFARPAAAMDQMPKDFVVQSSLDGVTWTNEWSVTNQIGWVASEMRAFSRP